MSSHDFAVIVRQDIVMRQYIIDCLEQVHQVYSPPVAPEEPASNVAWLVNFNSSFVWNVWPGLPLELLKAFAWCHKWPVLRRMQNSHIVLFRNGLPWEQ